MSAYKYNEEAFTISQKYHIKDLIKREIDEELFKRVVRIKSNGKPVYSSEQLEQIKYGIVEGLTREQLELYMICNGDKPIFSSDHMFYIRRGISEFGTLDKIKYYAKVNKNFKPVYSVDQMIVIYDSFIKGFTVDDVEIFAKLDKNMKPIYDGHQMKHIQTGIKEGFPKEVIDFYSKLNDSNIPIYNADQMLHISTGYSLGLTLDEIKVYAALKNGKPIFDYSQMYRIKFFILDNRNEKTLRQLKECIKKELSYEQIFVFIENNSSADTIRIAKSFYDLNCGEYEVKEFLKRAKSDEELKEAKYLLRCAKLLGVDPKLLLFSDKESNLIEPMRELFAMDIVERRKLDTKCVDFISRCLSHKMPPEQLDYITNIGDNFNLEEVKSVAITILNGLTIEEIRNIVNCNKLDSIKTLPEALDDAVRMKFNGISNMEEEIDIKSDWFEENDIER